MNKYLLGLNKIEFAVTYACTGRCKHCSEGDHIGCTKRIDPEIAADAVRRIAREYDIETVMVFGGEPLLHIDALESIISSATEIGIKRRQVITNGYFTRNDDAMRKAAQRLFACGVNDLLLSVDAFHQETIPLDVVKRFASALNFYGVPMRLSPAWLVSKEDDNPYNRKTREILDHFHDLNIAEGEGNTVFREGNAIKYLSEYFTESNPINPYIEDPHNIKCISFSPNGDVLGDNIYHNDIMEIIKNYE